MAANLLRKYGQRLPPRVLKQIANLWTPFLGAGIRIERFSADFRHAEVSMTLKWYNANYVGVHFGGSIYAMVDPFYMLMLLQNLGDDYIVWDKAATIEFKKPGRGRITATFRLTEAQVAAVKRSADEKGKHVFSLPVEVVNQQGEVVAQVTKTLYVKRKDAKADGA